MTIQETKTEEKPGRGGGMVRLTRVRKLAQDEEMPAGAVQVDDKTKTHDWQEEE